MKTTTNNLFSIFKQSPSQKFVYLEPQIKTTSVIFVLIIIAFFYWVIYQYNYVLKNWEDVKCKNGNFYVATLYGKNKEETIKECTKMEQQDAIDKSLMPIYNKIDEIGKKISNVGVNINNVQINADNKNDNIQNVLSNFTISIQKNILYVKESLSKIIGALVLSTYITDGTIKTTKVLENSSISKSINDLMNYVIPNNNQQ